MVCALNAVCTFAGRLVERVVKIEYRPLGPIVVGSTSRIMGAFRTSGFGYLAFKV